MKYFMRMIASFLCLVFAVTLLSCAKPDISDPLAKNPDLMENVTNDWMPILEKEECLATMGMGNSEDTIHLSTNWRFANYGNCLYFWGYYTYKAESGAEMRKPMLMRYDLRTGETYPACRDSACLHRDESCPFFMGNINAYIMDKNIIYMLKCETKDGEVDTSKPGGIYSYNVDTMEYKLIAERETGATNYFGYHDKKLYYVQNEYKDKTKNEHDKYIWSCDVKTGKTKKLFCYGDETDNTSTYEGRCPLMIDESGRMIFINYISFDERAANDTSSIVAFEYAELKKDADVVTITEYRSKFSSSSKDTLHYLNGKLYFNEVSSIEKFTYQADGEERERDFTTYAINYVDLENGQTGTLINNTKFGFAVAGDYLYYMPYSPKAVTCSDENSYIFMCSENVMQRNVVTQEEKSFAVKGVFSVGTGSTYYYRGRLYTYCFFENELNQYEESPAEVDLITGEFRRIPKNLIYLM